MSAKNSAILAISLGVILLFLSMLYPPWVAFTRNAYGGLTELPCGHGFLFTQPEPQTPSVSIKIDFTRLFVYWGMIVGGVALALLWIKKRATAASVSKQTATSIVAPDPSERAPETKTPGPMTDSRSETPGAPDS